MSEFSFPHSKSVIGASVKRRKFIKMRKKLKYFWGKISFNTSMSRKVFSYKKIPSPCI